jgi:hypothetical protein
MEPSRVHTGFPQSCQHGSTVCCQQTGHSLPQVLAHTATKSKRPCEDTHTAIDTHTEPLAPIPALLRKQKQTSTGIFNLGPSRVSDQYRVNLGGCCIKDTDILHLSKQTKSGRKAMAPATVGLWETLSPVRSLPRPTAGQRR